MRSTLSLRVVMLAVAVIALVLGLLATHDIKLGRTNAIVSLTIHIRDNNLKPIEGAKIQLFDADINHPVFSGYSNANGDLQLICKTAAIAHAGPFFTHYKKINYYYTIKIEHDIYKDEEDFLTSYIKESSYYDDRYYKKPIIIDLLKK